MPSSMWELLWEHVYQPVCVHDGGIITAIERGRDPCWWRVVDECGIGYIFGVILGVMKQTWDGNRMAAPGRKLRVIRDRLVTQVPLAGGNFAAWTTSFALTECTMIKLRGGTEDVINPTVAGAGAGAFTNFGGGYRAMRSGARTGALLLGSMELLMNAYSAYQTNLQLQASEAVPEPPEPPNRRGAQDPRYTRKRRLKEFQWTPTIPDSGLAASA
eukprot:TRINITY_DN65007_c0_g1_i1.p2 TRINITY_DN65007_c0_g1~~TRINITY_DN65007_c0_g1_i1.p2  ORF type:complete len:215 (+),score=55.54 TRINITY_DN65007_c0_g1_i1:148-792(+)